jgi:hypothetical protein
VPLGEPVEILIAGHSSTLIWADENHKYNNKKERSQSISAQTVIVLLALWVCDFTIPASGYESILQRAKVITAGATISQAR